MNPKKYIMKVKDLIKELNSYNPEAEVSVISNYNKQEFSVCYGDEGEGTSKENTNSVNFYLLNQTVDSPTT